MEIVSDNSPRARERRVCKCERRVRAQIIKTRALYSCNFYSTRRELSAARATRDKSEHLNQLRRIRRRFFVVFAHSLGARTG